MKVAVLTSLLLLAFAASAFTALTPGPVVVDGQSLPVIADLDGNGLDDVILDRSVLLNYGNGQFVTRDLGLAGTDRVVDSLDLNGDGRMDLLTRDIPGSGPGQIAGPVSYRLYIAGESMNYGTGILINTSGTSVPYIADVNGDGKDDIILVRAIFRGVREVASELTVLVSRGDGTFDARAPLQIPPTPQFGRYDHHLLAADLNHDGITDIVIRTVTDLIVLRGTGGGNFVPQSRFLANEPFGWWSTGLADIDRDGNLDVVTAGFRSVRILFGDGRGGFSRVAAASLPRLRTVSVPDYMAVLVGDRSQAPRNFAIGEFVAAGRTEIAAATAEGDVVILAFVQGRLQEVARTPTEFILPDVHAGAFRQSGRVDLYVTWNLGYGSSDFPKPRLFYSQPSRTVSVVSQSGGKSRASRTPASPPTFVLRMSGDCVPPDAAALRLTRDGIFGSYRRDGETMETVIDDEGMMHVRLDAPWLTSSITSTLSATERGYEGTSIASTSCGQQSVSFVAER